MSNSKFSDIIQIFLKDFETVPGIIEMCVKMLWIIFTNSFETMKF